MTASAPTLVTLLALFACAPASSAPARPARAPAAGPSSSDAAKADLDWRGDLTALKLGTVNGDVTITRAAGRQARVRGFKSGPDAADVRIEVDETDGRVFVHAEYPKRGDTDARVDFVVEVPDGTELEADVVTGDVDVRGVNAPVAVRSVNGDIATAGSPDVEVSTVNGSVVVRLPDAARRAKLDAVNGRLEVRLPAKLGAKLRASTVSGRIDSDFPLQHGDELVGARATGQLGNGKATVTLETVNGGIKIARA
jgi:DUF4097 and DUF4098 domain-containing protein YvlB